MYLRHKYLKVFYRFRQTVLLKIGMTSFILKYGSHIYDVRGKYNEHTIIKSFKTNANGNDSIYDDLSIRFR